MTAAFPPFRDLGSDDDAALGPRKYAPPERRHLDKIPGDDYNVEASGPGQDVLEGKDMISLDKFEADLAPKEPLTELAEKVSRLTYGEMMILAAGVCKQDETPHELADRIDAWSRKAREPSAESPPQEVEMAAGEDRS